MLITRLELENIKSYKKVTVDFQRGTTAISGANGAGKTTLVEAIGFALFDSMAYKQDQFVREGEKYGRVVVHLTGNDERPYVVDRRCGSGALWTLYDQEADYRLEQRADVQDKLHELFGVERERSLASLFHDALGVPQGTFTSIFLLNASARKQTFNALLQIEDYHTAALYLLDAQKQYKEQLLVQEREIQRLSFETRDLPAWRTSLNSARAEDQGLKARNIASVHRLEIQQAYFARIKHRLARLQLCTDQRKQRQLLHETAHQRLTQTQEAWHEAQAAHQKVEASRADYELFARTKELLTQLRLSERRRNELLKNQAELQNTHSTIRANLKNIQQRLDEVAQAHQRILELLPTVEIQNELEKQIATLGLEVQQYEALRKDGIRLYERREKLQQDQLTHRQHIAEFEPLQPLAEQLQTYIERLARLKSQSEQRSAKKTQLDKQQRELQEKREELLQLTTRLRASEEALRKIEAHREQGEEYALLLVRQRELESQLHHLHGNIEGYTDSLQRSAGGQCPLLHQACLNIQRQGQLSLEDYFSGLLTQEQGQLDALNQEVAQLVGRSTGLKKYADALLKVPQYLDQRESLSERTERLNGEIQRQEGEVESLAAEWQALQSLDQEIAQVQALHLKSKDAAKKTSQLTGLYNQIEQLQAQIIQYSEELDTRRRESEPFKQSKERLQERRQELDALDDPRSKSRAAQETARHENAYRQSLERERASEQETLHRLAELAARLVEFADLDQKLAEQERVQAQASAGYHLYLQNEKLAASMPERERLYSAAQHKMQQAISDLEAAERAYQEAIAAFDEQEFQVVEAEIKELEREITHLATAMQNLQEKINELTRQISVAETLLIELAAAETEKKTLDDLATMMEHFRKLIKDAAPMVLSAMLSDISAEANRIFGEVMGDRSAQLTWNGDYEINLVRQGVKRSFAQLSGGEQMSAALAVRLALLKKLSTLNLAFFDEPTQNMDEQRRTNLAEQIRRVRGFDQLIVISHDDTFEQGLDSLIRLHKRDGETRVLNEIDDAASSEPLSGQVNAYAS